MANYETSSNIALYLVRKEPVILRDADGSYISLRFCNNPMILETLEKKLQECEISGARIVICPWISPPFNEIAGYGEYTRSQSKLIRRRQLKEKWGYPRFGRSYGLQDIITLLEQCGRRISNRKA